ncbi:hypothetical protein C1646_660933 [Rhizophagus diaphanus]|nr:hypothetical protein C1646_660933 [Rhizophagus diaphanus] [Rhizophagus sp. MUCL 43196]
MVFNHSSTGLKYKPDTSPSNLTETLGRRSSFSGTSKPSQRNFKKETLHFGEAHYIAHYITHCISLSRGASHAHYIAHYTSLSRGGSSHAHYIAHYTSLSRGGSSHAHYIAHYILLSWGGIRQAPDETLMQPQVLISSFFNEEPRADYCHVVEYEMLTLIGSYTSTKSDFKIEIGE